MVVPPRGAGRVRPSHRSRHPGCKGCGGDPGHSDDGYAVPGRDRRADEADEADETDQAGAPGGEGVAGRGTLTGVLATLSALEIALLAVAASLVGLSKTALPGAGTITVAVFAAVLPARESTGALLVLLILGDLFAVRTYHAHADWRTLRRMVPAVLVGVAVGTVFLALADDAGVRRVIAVDPARAGRGDPRAAVGEPAGRGERRGHGVRDGPAAAGSGHPGPGVAPAAGRGRLRHARRLHHHGRQRAAAP